MLSSTCISALLLVQLTSNIASKTIPPYLQTYWKTTYVTDQIPDYWNHWSIHAPVLLTQEEPDIFLPWLNKITPSSTITEIGHVHDEMQAISTEPTAAAAKVVNDGQVHIGHTKADTTAAIPPMEAPVFDDYAKIDETKTESSIIPTDTTEAIPPSMKAIEEVQPVLRAIERQALSEPFSVFLQKIFKILASKEVKDMPYLINHFKEYVSSLLTGGQLGELGVPTNSYIATRLLILDTYPMKPLRAFFNKLQKKLAKRYKELPEDINEILNYMDDTYDETEEEAMQAVLREAALYPNTKNYNKIAQGFVDYVFLKPMQRMVGTARGNELFEMIQKSIIKYNKPNKTTRKRKATWVGPPLRTRIAIVTHYRKNFKKKQIHEIR